MVEVVRSDRLYNMDFNASDCHRSAYSFTCNHTANRSPAYASGGQAPTVVTLGTVNPAQPCAALVGAFNGVLSQSLIVLLRLTLSRLRRRVKRSRAGSIDHALVSTNLRDATSFGRQMSNAPVRTRRSSQLTDSNTRNMKCQSTYCK